MKDWEDSLDQSWATTLALFTTEYGKIQRALERASQRKDYDSAAALCDSTTCPTNMSLGTPQSTSVPETAVPVSIAMSEYVTALKGKVIELETVVETQSVITDTADFATSATTSNTTAEMTEMQAAAKSTAGSLARARSTQFQCLGFNGLSVNHHARKRAGTGPALAACTATRQH